MPKAIVGLLIVMFASTAVSAAQKKDKKTRIILRANPNWKSASTTPTEPACLATTVMKVIKLAYNPGQPPDPDTITWRIENDNDDPCLPYKNNQVTIGLNFHDANAVVLSSPFYGTATSNYGHYQYDVTCSFNGGQAIVAEDPELDVSSDGDKTKAGGRGR